MHLYKIELTKNGNLFSRHYIEKGEQVYAAVYNIFAECFKEVKKEGVYPGIYFTCIDKLGYQCRIELKVYRISTIEPRRINIDYYKGEWELYPTMQSGADDDRNIGRTVSEYINSISEPKQEAKTEELYYAYCPSEEKWLVFASRGFGNEWTKDKSRANRFSKDSIAFLEAYFKEYGFNEQLVFVKE